MFSLVTSSGKQTTSAQVCSMTGFLAGFDVIAPTTGICTLVFYDSSDSNTTGKLILAEAEVDAGMPSLNHDYTHPVAVNNGIYVSLTGGGSYIVRYGL